MNFSDAIMFMITIFLIFSTFPMMKEEYVCITNDLRLRIQESSISQQLTRQDARVALVLWRCFLIFDSFKKNFSNLIMILFALSVAKSIVGERLLKIIPFRFIMQGFLPGVVIR